MTLVGNRTAALVSVASLALATSAVAHDDLEEAFAECTCVTHQSKPPEPLARITRVDGNVFATTTNGYQNATVGMPLNEGNEVTTSVAGSAQILVGKRCKLEVAPSRRVTISLAAGRTHHICAIVGDLGPAALPENIRVGIAIKALVGFGLTGVVLSGGDYPASD